MVHSPNDALQSHKVSGQHSPRGRVSGQKSCENPGNPEKLSPGEGGGGGWGTGVGDHLGTCPPISVSIDGTLPNFLWWIALLKVYKPTKFRGETYQAAGSVGKEDLKIPKSPYMASALHGKCLTWQVPCMAIALYGNCLVWQVP